jgi:hypothetical protein
MKLFLFFLPVLCLFPVIFAGTNSAWSDRIWFNPVSIEQKGATSRLAGGITGFTVSPNPAGQSRALCIQVNGEISRNLAVRLGIYSLNGKLVRLLPAMEQGTAGKMMWDQRDQAGQPLANGLYLVRLTAGRQTFENRLLLLK